MEEENLGGRGGSGAYKGQISFQTELSMMCAMIVFSDRMYGLFGGKGRADCN